MEKTRDKTIDIIKGFAIMAVVLLHIDYAFPKYVFLKLGNALGGSWHVAVFFIVGGWFLSDAKMLNLKHFLLGKVKSLYLKSILICVPLVLLHNIFLSNGWLYTDVLYNNRFITMYSEGDFFIHALKQFLLINKEPFAGAMWFVDSLFLGLSLYGIISVIALKICMDAKKSFYMRGIVFLVIAVLSSLVQTVYRIEIPKISNTCSILILLYVGQYLGMKKLVFNNKMFLLASLLLFWQYNILHPGMNLVHNSYSDVVFLVIAPLSALYIIGFVGNFIKDNFVGKTIAFIGKESFVIMGVHMVGFHLFTAILQGGGMFFEHHFTTPHIDDCQLLVGYFLFGVGFPLLLVVPLRYFSKKLKSCL